MLTLISCTFENILFYTTVEGCIGFGLPRDPTEISRGAGGFTFAAGGSGRSENVKGDLRGMVGFGM